MKLPSNKTPCVLNRQADTHALLIKSCLAAFQEKPISRHFFFKKTNVFCLAFKLIFLELLLSCLAALTLASHAYKELGGINLFISYDTQKKKIYARFWGQSLSQ